MNSIEGRNHRTQGAGKGGAVIVVVDVVVVERTGKQKSSLSSASKPGNSRVTTGQNGRKKGGGAANAVVDVIVVERTGKRRSRSRRCCRLQKNQKTPGGDTSAVVYGEWSLWRRNRADAKSRDRLETSAVVNA